MGYSYSYDNKLCCDYCGASNGQTRKYRCPWNYCQAVAACPKCRKEHAADFGKKRHRKLGCEVKHMAFMAREDELQKMLKEGKYVRCSAVGIDYMKEYYRDPVHVLFRGIGGDDVGLFMEADVYHVYDYGVHTTPEDYKKHGICMDAPPIFINGKTTKEVQILMINAD